MEPPGKNGDRARLFMGLAVLATLLAYLPIVDNRFVEWDDSLLIIGNYHIRHLDLRSIGWIFTNPYEGNYIPLTWLSLALDFKVGRLEPWVYHLNDLILQCLNTAIVFYLSLKLLRIVRKAPTTPTKKGDGGLSEPADRPLWAAFGTALLFGLHPIHVESVAWASERKDILCGSFYFLGLWVYLDYALAVRSPAAGNTQGNTRRKYFACLGLFIAALLSKPTAVSLPFVLLLLDHWPLGRLGSQFKKCFMEKIPFGIATLAASGIAMVSQRQVGALSNLQQFPLFFRLMNAGHSVLFYLWNMLYPFRLAAYYPCHPDEASSFGYVFSVFSVLAVSCLCWIYRKKYPYFLTAWFFYLMTLAPVIGIIQVGSQAAADRYAYLPSWGIFLLAAAFLARSLSRRPWVLFALALAGTALLGYRTHLQVSFWKDTVALWENVFRCYPKNNYEAYHNLASAYEKSGQWDKALFNYSVAIRINPYSLHSYWGKANVLSAQGSLEESIGEFKDAIKMDPRYPPLHTDLAMVYQKKGMVKEALAEAEEAVQMDPNYPVAYNNLGIIEQNQGRMEEALADFAKARTLDPDNADYLRNLIAACQKAGKPKEALALYRELSSRPRSLVSLNF